MTSHNRTPSVSSLRSKSYAQLAEQALFVVVLSGFLVMAGGFMAEVLSFHSDARIATAPALVKPDVKPQINTPIKTSPNCGQTETC